MNLEELFVNKIRALDISPTQFKLATGLSPNQRTIEKSRLLLYGPFPG